MLHNKKEKKIKENKKTKKTKKKTSKELTKKKQGKQYFFNAKTKDEENLVVTKLESAFMIGATDEQACIHADISKKSLYRYIEKYPEFRHRKETIKKKNGLLAKAIIHNILGKKNANNKPVEEVKSF